MKKIFDRNGKKLKPSKVLAVFVVYEVLREKLNSQWATTVGTDWSEIKKKKHEEETEEKGTNGRRNEEEKTGGEKKHIHFRIMFPVLTKWSAISGDRRKFNSVFILSREGRGNQGQLSC